MKKLWFVFALCIAAAFAYADPVSDALRTFFTKGSCIDFEFTIDAKEEGSGTFSIIVNRSAFELEMIARFKGTSDGETKDMLLLGDAELPMSYIKSITNDANGNLIITLRPLSIADIESGDMGDLLEELMGGIF